MAKTFNRRPLQVNTPSSNDVKNYFFNHCNWKGVNNDKNFLTVDQETFADAKNIYIDAEGLLRSRPSVKRKGMFFDSAIDFWNFDDVDVYLLKNKDEYQLNFVKDGESNSKFIINENVKLVRIQNNIFCFTDNDFFYFNTEYSEFGDGFDKVYIPNTVFDAAGVKTKSEYKNLLTDKEKYTYLYNNEFGISTEAYGKNLNVKIKGNKYDLTFDSTTSDLLTDVLFTFPEGYNYFEVSNNETYLFYSESKRIISYSATGKTLSKNFILPQELGEIVLPPKFSKDSNYIIVGTEKSLYIVSVVADTSTGIFRFADFTDVSSYISDFYWPLVVQEIEFVNVAYDFVTYDEFVYCVTSYVTGMLDYDVVLTYVNKDNVVTKELNLEVCYDLILSKEYKQVLKDDSVLFDGAIFLYGQSGTSILSILFDLEELTGIQIRSITGSNSDILMDVKITGNRIVLLENRYNTQTLVILTQNLNTSEPENAFITNYFNYASEPSDSLIPHRLSYDASKIFFDNKVYFINNDITKSIVAYDTVHEILFYGKYLYYKDEEDNVFSSLIDGSLEFDYIKDGDNNLINVDAIGRLGDFYFASDKILYISSYREEDGEFHWYLPETNKQTFDKTITGLQPISSSEMGVFFDDEIWYVHKNENVYYATKTKLELGVKFGSDITISYDGSRLIFPTERGIVALSYQDFVASTDQVLTFLSDAVHMQMKEFCKKPVSIFKNDYWIFFYHKDSDKLYVFDIRNNSWWPWSLSNNVKKFVNHDNEIIFLSTNGFCRLNESSENYFDYDGKRHPIEWSLTSQKLHLSQINNYKHIINITFNSVIDTDDYLTFLLEVSNYREQVDSGKIENLHYNVDVLRTFVQRLNYFKVNEFQYTLRYDDENKIPLPLSLSSIGIKYKIQGQVR